MKLLALDTATNWLSVACGDGTLWYERGEPSAERHSERVLPLISKVLAEAGWPLAEIDGIAFGAGPGAFTGVRIACGVAQGLAFGVDVPIVPIPTLEAMAQAAWRESGATQALVCVDARMREVYVAAYQREGDAWRVSREPAVVKPAAVEVPPSAAGSWLGIGNGFAVYPELQSLPGLARVAPDTAPSARAIGELALPRFAAGEGVAAADARPLYVRHRIALTTLERDAGLRL